MDVKMVTYSNELQFARILVGFVLLVPAAAFLDKCYVKPEVVVPDADVQFGLLLSLRTKISPAQEKQRTSCGAISRSALEQFMAAEWLVHRINAYNNGTGYIPGVKIGFQSLDDCGSPFFASRNALTFLDQWPASQCPVAQGTSQPQVAEKYPLPIGFVGPSNSDIAMEVAHATCKVPLPVISMAATAPQLSNKESYPTFLRTVPSDEKQMNAIVDMLHGLKWTYIAVIHINDTYGRSASDSLARQAVARGICIQQTLVLTSDALSSNKFSFELSGMLQKSLGNSLAVVFIGNSTVTDDLLYKIEKLHPLRAVKFGLRVILTSPESSPLESKIFDTLDNYGEGTLALRKITVNMSVDLESDMRRLIRDGKEIHNLVEKYAAKSSKTDLFQTTSQNPLIPQTLHAVMALAEAVRAVHSDSCGGIPGPCQAMVEAVESSQLLAATYNAKLDYSKMDPDIVPSSFINDNLVIQFDEQGDISLPAYTIHQYRKSNKKYMQVGVYQNGRTMLQLNQMRWLTPEGDPATQMPTSVCNDNCDKVCLPVQGKGALPLAVMPGTDGYIIGLFSIHNKDDEEPFNCDDFRLVSNDAIVAEGFLFAVQRLRNMTGLKFGAIGIDDCYSPLRASSILYDLFSNLPSANLNAFPELGNFKLDQVVGVVACRSSGCTIPVASLFMQLHINVVSYAASSPDLDDKANFPYFLRTVPSDVFQAEVMLSIIRKMGWEFAGLLYVNNNYGKKAMETFKKLALESRTAGGQDSSSDTDAESDDTEAWPGLCLANEIAIEETQSVRDIGDFFDVWKRLQEQGVKIVVFFGINSRYRAFLKYLEEKDNHGKFIFLASEEWATNEEILKTSPRSARGSITLKVEEVDLEDVDSFRRHLSSKRPSHNDINIWFSEFWQHSFQCNLPGGFINIFDKTCDSNLQLSAAEVTLRTSEQRCRHAMNAVYALGKGLKLAADQLCEGKFPCRYLRLKTSELTSMIRKQSRRSGSLTFPVFGDDGNGALGFEVYNIQKRENGAYGYEKVGTFNSRSTHRFDKDKIKFYTDTGQVLDSMNVRCTEALCGHCPAPPRLPPPEMDVQSHCPNEYQEPDIVIISLIGVLILAILVAIAAVVLCVYKNRTALKKTILSRDEQIYDEPERHVYQQYMDTHGFRFANLNIEPLLGRSNNLQGQGHSVGGNRYEQSLIGGRATHGANGGFHNEAFIHDGIDSVSQIFSPETPQHRQLASHSQNAHVQPSMGTDMVRSRSRSFQAGTGPSPSLSQRPIPVSSMGPADTMSNIMHDNMAYHDALSDVLPHSRKMVSVSGTPTHTTNSNRNGPNGAANNTADALTPSSCSNNSYLSNTSGATINSSQAAASPFYHLQQQQPQDQEAGIVYYMQNQNGQLTATHIPSGILHDATLPTQNPCFVQLHPSGNVPNALPHAPPVMHQISQQSDNSSVNPDYGPYSQAVAVQKALQQFQQHQNQLQQSMGLHHLGQQHGLQTDSLEPEQLMQQPENPTPHPPTSQPPRPSIPTGSNIELQEMPGQSFFTGQPKHQQSPLAHQHHSQQAYQPQTQHENNYPPPPHTASSYLFRALSPPQQQQQHQNHQRHQQNFAAEPLAVRTTEDSTRRATDREDIPLTHTPDSEIPADLSTDSEGYIDTAIGSSLSASPGVGLEAPVKLDFQPELSHDPRPPNDLYLESIDLSSTLPEVNAISPASTRRGNNIRPEALALSVLDTKVSKV